MSKHFSDSEEELEFNEKREMELFESFRDDAPEEIEAMARMKARHDEAVRASRH